MSLVVAALAAFVVVEVAKFVTPVPPWVRPLLATAVAGLVLVGLDSDRWAGTRGLAYAVAGAGLAAVIQKAHRLLSALGDAQQVAVLLKGQGRRF